jgi:hypothetical protein
MIQKYVSLLNGGEVYVRDGKTVLTLEGWSQIHPDRLQQGRYEPQGEPFSLLELIELSIQHNQQQIVCSFS